MILHNPLSCQDAFHTPSKGPEYSQEFNCPSVTLLWTNDMAPSVRLNPGWVSSISSSREKRPGMQSEWRSTFPVPSLRALHWIIWARSDSAEIARHCLPVKDDATRSSSSASTFAPTWSQGRVGETWKKNKKNCSELWTCPSRSRISCRCAEGQSCKTKSPSEVAKPIESSKAQQSPVAPPIPPLCKTNFCR